MSERWRATQLACRNPAVRLTPLPTVNGSTLQPFSQIRDGFRKLSCGRARIYEKAARCRQRREAYRCDEASRDFPGELQGAIPARTSLVLPKSAYRRPCNPRGHKIETVKIDENAATKGQAFSVLGMDVDWQNQCEHCTSPLDVVA